MDPSSLPEVTLPIDDALFASCKEILAKYDPQYDANAMPANLEEAKSDLTKMAAMLASIERAQQAIETEAAALTGGQSVSDACAALDAQILTLTVQVQQKDNEIVQLEQQLDTAAPEEQDAIRAEIESKKLNRRLYRPSWTLPPASAQPWMVTRVMKAPFPPPRRPCGTQRCC